MRMPLDTGSESNPIMFCRLLKKWAWRINKAKFAWKQAIRFEISPSIKDNKGKRPSAILNKFRIVKIVWPQRFRKVPFSSCHTYTQKERFQKVPLWRVFPKSFVFIDLFHRIRVDGSRIRKAKVAFSNEKGYVWTGPKSYLSDFTLHEIAVK